MISHCKYTCTQLPEPGYLSLNIGVATFHGSNFRTSAKWTAKMHPQHPKYRLEASKLDMEWGDQRPCPLNWRKRQGTSRQVRLKA